MNKHDEALQKCRKITRCSMTILKDGIERCGCKSCDIQNCKDKLAKLEEIKRQATR